MEYYWLKLLLVVVLFGSITGFYFYFMFFQRDKFKKRIISEIEKVINPTKQMKRNKIINKILKKWT
jgi:hypothetical protein